MQPTTLTLRILYHKMTPNDKIKTNKVGFHHAQPETSLAASK